MSAERPSEAVTRGMVELAANHFRALGVEPGRRIALQVEPNAAGVAAILGASLTGATVSPLNPAWTHEETLRVLKAFRPGVLIAASDTHAPQGLDVGVRVVPIERVGRGAGRAGEDSGASGLPTWVLWTSGTSGRAPRGVVCCHRAFEASARSIAERLRLSPSDRWLCTLSPAHVGGLALILRAVTLRSELHAPGPFRVEVVSEALDRDGITHASLVPTQLRRLLELRRDRPVPPSLRCLLVGGAAPASGLIEEAVERGYPVALTWGMTEAASQVATAEVERVRRKPGSVGPPLDGVELRVVPEATPILGEGNPGGELFVRSPTLAEGIFRGPDDAPAPLTDDEGWYRTGDLGRLDVEGDLWIVGRSSDRIITGGVNVSPGEVEAGIAKHPAIREVAVLGLPDPEWGERVVAVAVLRPGAVEPTLEDLRRFVESSLAPPKRPREIRYLDRLPRNANGKVDRSALRDRLIGGS
ncbi:MAG: hypothetical protein EA351_10680 [Gemmatimonadales bacterium]|nr:MAG: hypothetical protein EA351_10680 [Gemmatimonadales bacterium]